jgi:hypothetical protein
MRMHVVGMKVGLQIDLVLMKVRGPVCAPAMTPMAMLKQGHQGADGGQEIGQNPEKVSPVPGPDKEGGDQQEDG